MHPFGTAVAAGDIDAALALLAEDVVFRSPVVHTPYRGRDAVATILHAVSKVFEDSAMWTRSARRTRPATSWSSAPGWATGISTASTSCIPGLTAWSTSSPSWSAR